MKNPLADLYQQVLLNEAEKHNLQNPSSDEVGNLKPKAELFGSKPKPVEGAEKAKLQKGPTYKETTGSASAPKASSSSFKGSAPAKETKVEEGEEMEDTEVDPTEEEDEETEEKKEVKKEIKQENFTMSAFETLFKKTLTEEIDEVTAPEMESDEELNLDTEEGEEGMEEELEEEEADLVSDLRELQDKLAAILSKLEDVAEEESEEEESEDYTEEEFDEEFGEEEEGAAMKESMDKPKPLNSSKGKALMSKKNKVGRLSAKGGKANGGSLKHEPKPKALGDKKGVLQKGKPEVKSSVKKGDFIK